MPADFFIVPSGTPILGMDLFTALGPNIVNGCVTLASVLSTYLHQTTAWQISNPDVTGTLGYAKGFVHRVKIRPDVVPLQQKLRCLPFAVHGAVSQEVKMLEEAGIIERIDSSGKKRQIVQIINLCTCFQTIAEHLINKCHFQSVCLSICV